MLSPNGTFTSLSQVEEYIKQCKLHDLDLDDDKVWSKVYLPAARMTNDTRVYEGRIQFHHVHIQLISSNELLLGCDPLPDWLRRKLCIYAINNMNDTLCIWKCLTIFKSIRCNQERPAEDTTKDEYSTWLLNFTNNLICELVMSDQLS